MDNNKREQLSLCDGEDPFAVTASFQNPYEDQPRDKRVLLFAQFTRLSETQGVARVNNINSLFKTAPNFINTLIFY